jgi:hypothetical protein
MENVSMSFPTVESLETAARAGIAVLRPGTTAVRIPGAATEVAGSVIDVLYDAENDTFSWMVDGKHRSVEFVRRFLESQQ